MYNLLVHLPGVDVGSPSSNGWTSRAACSAACLAVSAAAAASCACFAAAVANTYLAIAALVLGVDDVDA